ncbi:MAG: hypothetical protein DRR42_09875 [Gammaproteobacteria bacterium]|nr:MAG: hypothetical protein DRR42_09875 [Gammaproteobacteria bacterium]
MKKEEEEEVTWERVIQECRKKPDDPIAQMFLGIHTENISLKELCRSAYMHSNICLKEGWILDYKRLVEND